MSIIGLACAARLYNTPLVCSHPQATIRFSNMLSLALGAVRLGTVRMACLILSLSSYFFFTSQLRTRAFRTYVTAATANDSHSHVVSTTVTIPPLQTPGESLNSVQGNLPGEWCVHLIKFANHRLAPPTPSLHSSFVSNTLEARCTFIRPSSRA